jgi:hypothetical protein
VSAGELRALPIAQVATAVAAGRSPPPTSSASSSTARREIGAGASR